MRRLNAYFFFMWSTERFEECVEKRVWACNLGGKIFKRLTRITKCFGDVKPTEIDRQNLHALVNQRYCIIWVNDCEMQDWVAKFVGMALCTQDYVNLVVVLGIKHFISALVKKLFSYHRGPGKIFMNTLLIFSCCTGGCAEI